MVMSCVRWRKYVICNTNSSWFEQHWHRIHSHGFSSDNIFSKLKFIWKMEEYAHLCCNDIMSSLENETVRREACAMQIRQAAFHCGVMWPAAKTWIQMNNNLGDLPAKVKGMMRLLWTSAVQYVQCLRVSIFINAEIVLICPNWST